MGRRGHDGFTRTVSRYLPLRSSAVKVLSAAGRVLRAVELFDISSEIVV